VYNIDNFYNDYFFLLVVLPIDCQEASSSESSISSDTPTTTMYRYSARAAALEGSQKGVGAITHVERQSVVEIEEMEIAQRHQRLSFLAMGRSDLAPAV